MDKGGRGVPRPHTGLNVRIFVNKILQNKSLKLKLVLCFLFYTEIYRQILQKQN